MSETLAAAALGALVGGAILILWQWWWERRTRWLDQRRVACLNFLFALDDFIGSMPSEPVAGSVGLQKVGRALYRAFEEFEVVGPTKGPVLEAAELAFASALNLTASAHIRESVDPEEWASRQAEIMSLRGEFRKAIRREIGLPVRKNDPFDP